MASRAALVLSLATAEGARINKRRSRHLTSIAGVQVRNFNEEAEDYIMNFAAGTTNAEIAAICAGECGLVGHPDQGGAAWAAVKGRAKLEHMLDAEQPSSLRSKIAFLEPDAMAYAVPLIETEVEATASWGLEKIGVKEKTGRGKGVHIYVMDTGIRTTHDSFTGRAFPGMDVSDGNVVVCNGDRECAKDTLGHGTHCAGTAGSETYGVADDAFVYAIKTLGENGGSNSWQFSGVDWVITSGERPAVISASLGSRSVDFTWSTVLKAATDVGITVVVAGGNSVEDACFFSPAFAPEAITVGAIDQSGDRAWYSNFGSCIDIMAPGTDIPSTWVTNDLSERLFSGTSMACPHVTGAAALVLEEDNSRTPAQVRALLYERSSYGIVNDLRGSADRLVWVGTSEAPTGAPTPAPAPTCGENSAGPDSDSDCKCDRDYECFENDVKGCSYSRPGTSVRYHDVTCAACECKPSRGR